MPTMMPPRRLKPYWSFWNAFQNGGGRVVRSRSRVHAVRGQATRTRIVEAARPLFVRDGYLETMMNGIATAAGVAVQTLYLAFGSKIAVLEAAEPSTVGR
jgi:AcrR family transcriptional regulator